MEDARIAPIERAAQDYAEIRDTRMELNLREAKLKSKLMGLMKEHGKKHYLRNGVEISIISESETVKVRLKKPGTLDDEPGEGARRERLDDAAEAGSFV